MTLHFKNYDNGWKWVKMIGAATFVTFLIRVIYYDSYARTYRVTLLEIMKGHEIELVLLVAGLAAYIFGKWKNYTAEICSILSISKYSQVDKRLEELKDEICREIPEVQQKVFLEKYSHLGSKMTRAMYLKNVKWELEKPQWTSQ